MYGVSAAYKAAMRTDIQRHDLRMKFSNFTATTEDILRDSVTLQGRASDSSDLSVGGVYITTLKFTLLNTHGIRRGTWRGKELELEFLQLISHPDTWERIPVGVFTIAEANHTEKGIEVTAYDHMAKLDVPYPGTETNGSIFDIMELICKKCGVTFGMTKAQCQALPNGDAVLGIYPENDVKTWRDLAHYIGQLVGGFVTADRQGHIVLRSFGNPTDYEVDASKRMTGSKFSDYTTNYTGVTVANLADKSIRSRSLTPDNGLTISLGNNPFLQYGTKETLDRMLLNILQEVNRAKFIPFSSAMVGNPAFDLGDVITYTEGTAGETSSCCIMAYTWKFNKNYSVQGFGKNPSLYGAQSKLEKQIGGLSNQSKSEVLQFFTYENAKKINIGDAEEKQIADLRFANMKETFVDFWIEVKGSLRITQVGAPAVVTVRYRLDHELDIYEPVLTFHEGGIYTFNLLRIWKLFEALPHTLLVYITIEGGTLEILPGDVTAVIKGQGMTEGEAPDGDIEIDETYSLIRKGTKLMQFYDDGPAFNMQVPERLSLVDAYSLSRAGKKSLVLTDSMTIIRSGEEFQLVTENGIALTTEAGDPYIIDGGS